jgi:hypothetical protein
MGCEGDTCGVQLRRCRISLSGDGDAHIPLLA